MNLDSWIVLKYLLSFLSVLWVKVDSDHFCVIDFNFIDDLFEGSTSAASDIKEVSLEHGHILHHLHMGSDCEECADEKVINVDWDFLD